MSDTKKKSVTTPRGGLAVLLVMTALFALASWGAGDAREKRLQSRILPAFQMRFIHDDSVEARVFRRLPAVDREEVEEQ